MIYEKISSTAETIAFALRESKDFPLAQPLAELCNAEEATKRFYRRPDFEIDLERMKKMGHWANLRLLALKLAILKDDSLQVLELASGFSPLGWSLSFGDSTYFPARYVESDLPEVIRRKKHIIHKRMFPFINGNHVFESLNALNQKQLKEVADRHFPGKMTIVHSGLLQYLSHADKRKLAKNIRKVFETREYSRWITPDITLKNDFRKAFDRSPYMQRIHEILNENTGTDMVENAFESFEEAEALFAETGFLVQKQSQVESIIEATTKECPFPVQSALPISNQSHQQIWTMTLK